VLFVRNDIYVTASEVSITNLKRRSNIRANALAFLRYPNILHLAEISGSEGRENKGNCWEVAPCSLVDLSQMLLISRDYGGSNNV
jgi:hypothetical protein